MSDRLSKQPMPPAPSDAASHALQSDIAGMRDVRVMLVMPVGSYTSALADYLRRNQFEVVEFADATEATHHIIDGHAFDVVAIEAHDTDTASAAMLHRFTDLSLAMPIAVLAASTSEAEESAVLEAGATEYIDKFRSPSIIAKRLRLLASGAKGALSDEDGANDSIAIGPLVLNIRSPRARWRGESVPLTLTECKIVRLLASRLGRSVSYREIYDVVRGSGFVAGDGPNGYRTNVRSLIRKIRRRFLGIDKSFDAIVNHPGFGYEWCADSAAANPRPKPSPITVTSPRPSADEKPPAMHVRKAVRRLSERASGTGDRPCAAN